MKTKQKHPLAARIKRLMQADEDVGKIASATPVLIGRAMELLLQKLCDGMCEIATDRNAKTVTPAHLKCCVSNDKLLDFLQDAVSTAPDLATDNDTGPKLKRQRTMEGDPSSPGPSNRGRGRPPGPGRGRGNPSLPPPAPAQHHPVNIPQINSMPSSSSFRSQLRSSLLQPGLSLPMSSSAPDASSRPVQPSTTSARTGTAFTPVAPVAHLATSTASNTKLTHKEATASSSDLPQRSVAASVDSSLPMPTAQGSTGSVHLPSHKAERSSPPVATAEAAHTTAVVEVVPPVPTQPVAVATFPAAEKMPDEYDDDYDS